MASGSSDKSHHADTSIEQTNILNNWECDAISTIWGEIRHHPDIPIRCGTAGSCSNPCYTDAEQEEVVAVIPDHEEA